jgi:hypothetical protein
MVYNPRKGHAPNTGRLPSRGLSPRPDRQTMDRLFDIPSGPDGLPEMAPPRRAFLRPAVHDWTLAELAGRAAGLTPDKQGMSAIVTGDASLALSLLPGDCVQTCVTSPPYWSLRDYGVPWRLAMALQAAGWYLRADIIWHKPNCQPESVKDRPTRCHEYVFLFSKSERYVYNNDGARGPNDRNLRTVWDINTFPYKDAQFATYPPGLVEPCVALGSNEEQLVLDPFLGSGTTGLVALQMRRRFIGIELNPEYVEITKRRLCGAIIDEHDSGRQSLSGTADPLPPTARSRTEDLAA